MNLLTNLIIKLSVTGTPANRRKDAAAAASAAAAAAGAGAAASSPPEAGEVPTGGRD